MAKGPAPWSQICHRPTKIWRGVMEHGSASSIIAAQLFGPGHRTPQRFDRRTTAQRRLNTIRAIDARASAGAPPAKALKGPRTPLDAVEMAHYRCAPTGVTPQLGLSKIGVTGRVRRCFSPSHRLDVTALSRCRIRRWRCSRRQVRSGSRSRYTCLLRSWAQCRQIRRLVRWFP
jgi:hypothetical protein